MNPPEQTLSSAVSAEPAAAERCGWTPSHSRANLITRGMVVWAVLATAVFIKPLGDLIVDVVQSDLHSYVLVIPFVVAYLLYTRRTRLDRSYRSSPATALTLIGIAAALVMAAMTVRTRVSSHDFLIFMTLAYVILIVAGGFLFLGAGWMSSAAFPMAFLFFLVPLPDRVVDALEKASVAASAEAANAFFTISGIPFLRDGGVFRLPTITLRVAQECSGIRSSWVLVISSLLASNLFLRTSWRRATLVAFVIPLGVIRNGFRILTLGVLCVQIGPHMIDSPIHHYGGPLFFALSLVPLFLLMERLSRQEQPT